MALIQLAANGQAHLIPVTIMVNGEFYDASAYKADPIPMALQYETVYEGFKSGVSQGLFTVHGAAQVKDNGSWFADGIWKTDAEIEAEKAKAAEHAAKLAQTAPPDEELGGPPKLRRAPESPGPAPSATAPKSEPAPSPSTTSSPKTSESKPSTPPKESPSYDSIDAPDRPVLRRQQPSALPHEQTKASPETAPLKGALQFIPAISDADGPQPRPYTYPLKPEEQQNFTKKLLALATEEVNNRAKLLESQTVDAKPQPKKARGAPTPQFQNVQLRAFDVSNTNEAVLVLTADATLPSQGDLVFSTTVVAREDIYGELQKIFGATTDSKHLDVLPKYELIDAVDADGDGRGELLFRETFDSSSVFVVYRVLGNRLWRLFQGKPGA